MTEYGVLLLTMYIIKSHIPIEYRISYSCYFCMFCVGLIFNSLSCPATHLSAPHQSSPSSFSTLFFSSYPCNYMNHSHPCTYAYHSHPCTYMNHSHPCTYVYHSHPCTYVYHSHPCTYVYHSHPCTCVYHSHPCTYVYHSHPCTYVYHSQVRSYTTLPFTSEKVHGPYTLLPADPSIDLWALGVLLYLLCTGEWVSEWVSDYISIPSYYQCP